MNKGLKIFLLVFGITIIMLVISIFAIYKYNIYKANKKAEKIEIGDNKDIEDIDNLEQIQQKEIKYDDIIGTLTIPDILLEDAPIKESTELSTLSNAIGHFTSTSIYTGNVGLASHNYGESGDFFRNLKNIKIGSEIFYQTNFGTKRYIVQTKVVIDETDFSYLQETEDNRITLITCVNNSPTSRLCVQAVENYEGMSYGQ